VSNVSSLLSFPRKVFVDPATSELFISDTSHHRILMAGADGNVQQQIGSGRQGLADGALHAAEFNHPQGLYFDSEHNVLFVADTASHAIRRVDLTAKKVTTLAGSGKRSQEGQRKAGGPGYPLNAPCDLLLYRRSLYAAMAGARQIWIMDPETGRGKVFAGSGRKNMFDGPRLDAALARPASVTTAGSYLYFTDAGAVRRVGFGDAARVETLGEGSPPAAGETRGAPESQQITRCHRIHEGSIYVADTWNHKISTFDEVTRKARPLCGTGEAGFRDGPFGRAQFDEPAGIAAAGDRLYIADAGNDQIRLADLRKKEVTTLTLRGVAAGPGLKPVELPIQHVAPGEVDGSLGCWGTPAGIPSPVDRSLTGPLPAAFSATTVKR
jgi:hypothetical protein